MLTIAAMVSLAIGVWQDYSATNGERGLGW